MPDLKPDFEVPPDEDDFDDLFLFPPESLHVVHAIFYHLFLGQLSVERRVLYFI
jgi:hypothetical protein